MIMPGTQALGLRRSNTQPVGPIIRAVVWLTLIVAILATWPGTPLARAGQPTAAPSQPGRLATFVPAARAAKNVAVITIEDSINKTKAISFKRRLDEAIKGGADAIVIDINSPGGEVGAVLDICAAIKECKVTNIVAWVHPSAYSGGAIIALACKEIISSESGTLGDAAPIVMGRALANTERAKILAPLLTEVVDSARLRGYDEKLVQGFVMLDVELWLIENPTTGQRMCVDRAEYKQLFSADPLKTSPTIAATVKPDPLQQALKQDRTAKEKQQINEAIKKAQGTPQPTTPGNTPSNPPGQTPDPAQGTAPASLPGPLPPAATIPPPPDTSNPLVPAVDPDSKFIPASPSVTPDLAKNASKLLTTPSKRLILTSADKSSWRVVEYISDGNALFTLKRAELQRYGLAQSGAGAGGAVNNDDDLKAYFGATNLSRLDMSVFESVAEFLGEGAMSFVIRGFFVVLFLICLFIEITHPGLVVPAAIAIFSLLVVLAPTILLGAGGWWQVAAIIVGIGMLLLEMFVLPGLGIFGIGGVLLLFAGLLGAFLPVGSSSLFPDSPGARTDLAYAAITVILSFATAVVGMYFVGKNFGSLPILRNLVLDANTQEGGSGLTVDDNAAPLVELGATGVAISVLRPSGKAQFADQIFDVIAIGGIISPGDSIRVTASDGFRVEVERIT